MFTRRDIPYIALILGFQVMSFGSGYYAAMKPATVVAPPTPILVTVQSAAPAPVDPQVMAFVKRSMTPVPVEAIPDAGPAAVAPAPVRAKVQAAPAPKATAPAVIKLEEDPSDIPNPYVSK